MLMWNKNMFIPNIRIWQTTWQHQLYLLQLSIKIGNENKCGAVLLNPELALTAAHCCDAINKYTSGEWSVVAGEYKLNVKENSEQVSCSFRSIPDIINPPYSYHWSK